MLQTCSPTAVFLPAFGSMGGAPKQRSNTTWLPIRSGHASSAGAEQAAAATPENRRWTAIVAEKMATTPLTRALLVDAVSFFHPFIAKVLFIFSSFLFLTVRK